MRAGDFYFIGQAASPDVLVAEEPRLTKLGDETAIEYEVPTRLHGITDVEVEVPYGKKSFKPERFGELFTEVEGEIIAHPSLDAVKNVMSSRREYGISHGPYFGQKDITISSYNLNLELNPSDGRILR
jgi:hypothetical protein